MEDTPFKVDGNTLYSCRRACASMPSHRVEICMKDCLNQQVAKYSHLEQFKEVKCIDVEELLREREEEDRRSSW